jgi:recombination protein RecT
MAMKSLLRAILGKWGIMSVDIQKALTTDQAVITDQTGEAVEYIDHEEIDTDKESERFLALIADSADRKEIEMYFQACSDDLKEKVREEYEKRIDYIDQIEDSKEQKKEAKK